MDILTLSAFAITYAIVCAAPGPGIAAIVARGLGGDVTLAKSPLGGLRAVVRLPG